MGNNGGWRPSRREVLKGAGVAALAGGVLASSHYGLDNDDPTADFSLPAFTAPETYTRRTAGGTFNRLFVNRGINHVGTSLPDDGDTYGAVCDGQDGDGYVTRRF